MVAFHPLRGFSVIRSAHAPSLPPRLVPAISPYLGGWERDYGRERIKTKFEVTPLCPFSVLTFP